jgi:upstream activation factor subunit UAF30
MSQIHDSAKAGDLEKVKELVKGSPELVFSKDREGRTPLHYAVSNTSPSIMEFLLASKAEVNAQCNRGFTPLHLAAANGGKAAAELLLANHADANAKGIFARTPLHVAVEFCKKDVVELLLANKADVNAADTHDGMTPLKEAESMKNPELVALLRRHVPVSTRPQSDPGAKLSLWKSSPEPESWVRKHLAGWNENDWLELLASLRNSKYWPMDQAAMGQHLEMLRDKLKAAEPRKSPTESPRVETPAAAASAVLEPVKAVAPPETPEIPQADEVLPDVPEKGKRKPSAAFMKPVTPDEKLAKIVGDKPLPRTELTKQLWVYIRKHGLQDPTKKTLINADENLKAVFDGKAQVSMFEMTKLVSGHVKK